MKLKISFLWIGLPNAPSFCLYGLQIHSPEQGQLSHIKISKSKRTVSDSCLFHSQATSFPWTFSPQLSCSPKFCKIQSQRPRIPSSPPSPEGISPPLITLALSASCRNLIAHHIRLLCLNHTDLPMSKPIREVNTF